MIELVLAHTDLARVRFAHSPIRELMASLLVLQDQSRQPTYSRWLSSLWPQIKRLRLEWLTELVPSCRYLPPFLLPPPTDPRPALAEELHTVATSSPAIVRTELDGLRDVRPLSTRLQTLYEDPAAHLPTIAEELQRYWEVAVQPVWPRVRAVCAADLTYRMERFADGGLARALADLHPELTLEGDRLRVDKPHHCSQRFDLAGTGILVMPCAFLWPTLMVDCCGVDQPAVTYPTRGVAELWDDAVSELTDPLSALVGRTRATLLATLGLPRTTTQLAVQLGVSAPAVSQHLKVLKEAALVTARRRGRMVLYQRTPAASALLKAVRSSGEEAG
jgi:DNA-binding transcriptional ArsR family regulator